MSPRFITISKYFLRTFENIFINPVIKKNATNDIRCRVPPSTKFNHGGLGVVIGKNVKLGKNVTINQGVTIGKRNGKNNVNIGDNVTIKTNAVIIGDLSVGKNSVIGAGAVVLDDIPPNSVAVGIPAKVVKINISYESEKVSNQFKHNFT